MEAFTSDLISLDTALQQILDQVTPIHETLTLPLADSAGYTLAEPVISPIAVPDFDNSAMDGYAVRLNSLNGQPLPVAGKIFAGQVFDQVWPAGTTLRIMTGAPIPAQADAVVMQEQVVVTEQGVQFPEHIKPGQNIRRVGEDITKGQQVIDQGTQLGVSQLPLLASLGIESVTVKRQVRVAIFTTGDELVPVGRPRNAGEIYDTNRFAIRLMLEKMHCQVIDLGIIADNEDDLRAAFQQANAQADVVISTGGVSVGEADYTRKILEELGEITFWKLAIKPGKPFAFGQLEHSLFCGLPGNPVSAVVTFYQLVQPLLLKLQGKPAHTPLTFPAIAETNLKKKAGRLDFQRGFFYVNPQGQFMVRPVGAQGSHIFSGFSQANCFIVLERERGAVQTGETVTIELFNELLSNQ